MLILADPLHLSALQTKFSYNGRTFTNCVLLHRLIITRQDEEILRRRHQLDPALLALGGSKDKKFQVYPQIP